jgi:hypothetical protein
MSLHHKIIIFCVCYIVFGVISYIHHKNDLIKRCHFYDRADRIFCLAISFFPVANIAGILMTVVDIIDESQIKRKIRKYLSEPASW